MQSYITVNTENTAELVEKKSRFIATLFHIESEEQAAEILSATRTKYWDARHNVYAYILKDGTARFSDDGEPHGTAGKPVLDVLQGSGITDALVVVTRYFGGILLGTGGLCRAYSGAARLVIESAQRVLMCPSVVCEIICPYPDHQKLTALIKDCGGSISGEEFTDSVKLVFSFKSEDIDGFEAALTETFSARIVNKRQNEEFSAFLL